MVQSTVTDHMLWVMSLIFTKLSMLFFYISIFPTLIINTCAYIVMGMVVAWGLSVIFCGRSLYFMRICRIIADMTTGFFLCTPFAYNVGYPSVTVEDAAADMLSMRSYRTELQVW